MLWQALRKPLTPEPRSPKLRPKLPRSLWSFIWKLWQPQKIGVIENPDNRKMYTNKLNGEKYEDINIPKVREQFCAKFYPYLNAKKKTNLSFTDRIKALRSKK